MSHLQLAPEFRLPRGKYVGRPSFWRIGNPVTPDAFSSKLRPSKPRDLVCHVINDAANRTFSLNVFGEKNQSEHWYSLYNFLATLLHGGLKSLAPCFPGGLLPRFIANLRLRSFGQKRGELLAFLHVLQLL